jgi:hypothetical protein
VDVEAARKDPILSGLFSYSLSCFPVQRSTRKSPSVSKPTTSPRSPPARWLDGAHVGQEYHRPPSSLRSQPAAAKESRAVSGSGGRDALSWLDHAVMPEPVGTTTSSASAPTVPYEFVRPAVGPSCRASALDSECVLAT